MEGIPILEYYSLSNVSKWAWLGIESAFFFAFFGLAHVALKYIKHVKR